MNVSRSLELEIVTNKQIQLLTNMIVSAWIRFSLLFKVQ